MKRLFEEYPYMESERIIIKRMEEKDAPALQKFINNEKVYRFLPKLVYELKYDNASEAISCFHNECFLEKSSIMLGVYIKDTSECFCGIAEIYHYDEEKHKVSIGCRLSDEVWGKGIAFEVTRLMTEYLFTATDINIIGASHIKENVASGIVLEKSGFVKIDSSAEEYWGYDCKKSVVKWCCYRE